MTAGRLYTQSWGGMFKVRKVKYLLDLVPHLIFHLMGAKKVRNVGNYGHYVGKTGHKIIFRPVQAGLDCSKISSGSFGLP